MHKRRKLTSPRRYLTQKLKGKRLTRQRIGRLHADMRAAGYVSSSPVTASAEHDRVWVHCQDPWALPARLAEREETVTKTDLHKLMGTHGNGRLPIADLSKLGIAAVPMDQTQVRLVGTTPEIANLANRFHHGKRRCKLTAKEFVRIMKNRSQNGQLRRLRSETLMECLLEAEHRYGLDLSDLINQDSILV